MHNSITQGSITPVHKYSVYMASTEVTLGGILHAARIPLTGYILSLFQAFCLAKAHRSDNGLFTSFYVSTTVSILKTLTPVGKKVGPMVAIIAQGTLFNLGVLCLGNNIAGHILGAVLLSFWGFIQPTLFMYLIFGQDLLAGLSTMEQRIDLYIPGFSFQILLIIIVCLKAFLASFAVLLARSSLPIETLIQEKLLSKYNILKQNSKRKNRSALVSIYKDLTNFWYLFSFTIVGLFTWWQQSEAMTAFFIMTNYLAYSIIFFMLLRVLNLQKFADYLKHLGFNKLSSTVKNTLDSIEDSNNKEKKEQND